MQQNTTYAELNIEGFLEGGILKEKPFRESLEKHDWEQYTEKNVLIKGCSTVPIPTWAYMIVTVYLMPVAGKIIYGEPCSSIPIYRKKKEHTQTV